MRAMRTVFFGSPDYALPTLRALLDDPQVEVVAAVTQPDRPRGRSGRTVPTVVRAMAEDAAVPVLAPERIRRDTTERIAALRPDVGVLAASGHILPRHLLAAFPHGVLNVHASLLPRHRGASPVAAAILAGDATAGASIMLVVRELDAGPVLGTVATAIEPLDTAGTLTDRIAQLGAELLIDLLPRWLAGEVEAAAQDEALATYAPRLTKQDGAIDWTRPAVEVGRQVRAFQPWPLATTTYRGKPLTVHEAWPLEPGAPGMPGLPGVAGAAAAVDGIPPSVPITPGTVTAGDGASLGPPLPERHALAVVSCGTGALALLRVQRAGRRALDIEPYLNGDPALIGSHLG